MGKLFGTDGVRGVANKELTPELAYHLGRAGAYVLSENNKKPRIVVGKDTRLSCDMLEAALIAGICSVGAEVVTCGVIPTPAIAFMVKKYGFDAGVVISASHNPYEYNGIKFFSSSGCKLPDEVENKIEEYILEPGMEIESATKDAIGRKIEMSNATQEYVDSIIATSRVDLSGLKIAVDCSNGAASKGAELLFKQLGIDATIIANEPNGTNINLNCGSTHLEGLCKLVKEGDFDMGIAFDGDADRMLSCDENGELIDGDKTMAIIARSLKKLGKLKGDTIVATVMSNIGLDKFAKENDIKIAKTKVGDRYVLEEMMKEGFVIGGEQSGHIILLDYNTTGDGMLTAVQLLNVLVESGMKASELASLMDVYPQVLKNARVKNSNKYSYMEDEAIAKMCKELEEEFKGEGRVLIRPSGTEPLVRVMIEGKDQEYITKKAADLANVIEERLG